MHKIREKQGYELDEQLQELWQVQLDLLEKFIDVCQRHKFRCWVDSGTLLGAVRHKGFIPWDDDVDVTIMREDYEKLIQIAPDEFKAPFFFQSAYTDTDYYRGQAQLRMDGTSAIRPSDCFQPFHQGIFIDIFPIDGLAPDQTAMDAALKKNRRILRFLKAKNTNILFSGRLTLIFRKIKARRAVARHGWATIYADAEKALSQFKVSDSDYLSFGVPRFVCKKSIYEDTVWLDYEDLKVPAPIHWDEYLRTMYGKNYMTPLKDPTAHGELIIDPHRDYRELLPQVQKEYRQSAINRLWKKIIK
jgi:lipopolysaccharide cholinephosphotransferase